MLITKIQEDALAARKARDSDKSLLLVTLFAEASRKGKDDGDRLSRDEEVVETVKKFIKDLKFTLDKTTNETVIAKTKFELAVLSAYLPEMLTGETLLAAIHAIANTLPELNAKAMGTIMGQLRTQYGGAYDGKEAKNLVESLLKK